MIPRNKRSYRLATVLVFAALLLTVGCAKQGYPSGGPKDTTPPQVLQTTPADKTLHFDQHQFSILFDEYVVLKDADNNILVSPPMEPKPIYTVKGHSIIVKLSDTLQPNTTYLFQFQEAIADFNEGNLLPQLSYVFSTGPNLDSLCIEGNVVDAFTQQPREDPITVMAYRADTINPIADSMAYRLAPTYITRCNKQGHFVLSHLDSGLFWIIALIDNNKNNRLDKGESMAFLSSPIASHQALPDSTHSAIGMIHMDLFDTDPPAQRILGATMPTAGTAVIATQQPMVQPSVEARQQSLIQHLNTRGDTLTLWYSKPTDSLHLAIHDPTGIDDTLHLGVSKNSKSTKLSQTQQPKTNVLTLRPSFKDKQPYYQPFTYTASTPIATHRADSCIICLDADSVIHQGIGLAIDSTGLSAHMVFDSTFHPQGGAAYTFTLLPSALTDIWGRSNDSLLVATTLTSAADYGTLHLTVVLNPDSINAPVIIEVLNDKNTTVASSTIDSTTTLHFRHLEAGNYRLRATIDANANGHWDPGQYAQDRQPETVRYFHKTLNLRANWDFEEQWDISAQPTVPQVRPSIGTAN